MQKLTYSDPGGAAMLLGIGNCEFLSREAVRADPLAIPGLATSYHNPFFIWDLKVQELMEKNAWDESSKLSKSSKRISQSSSTTPAKPNWFEPSTNRIKSLIHFCAFLNNDQSQRRNINVMWCDALLGLSSSVTYEKDMLRQYHMQEGSDQLTNTTITDMGTNSRSNNDHLLPRILSQHRSMLASLPKLWNMT